MAWSKYGQTTQSWKSTSTGGQSDGDRNAARPPNTSLPKGVLEEFVEFLESRGWTTTFEDQSDILDANSNPIGVNYRWRVKKSFLCEDGTTQTTGFFLQYNGDTTTTDTFNMWLIDGGDDTFGKQVESGAPSTAWDGYWSFWVSDEDADSFLILRTDASQACIGLWPPSGSLFAMGYTSTTYPLSGGLQPIFTGSGPAFTGIANADGDWIQLYFVGNNSYSAGLSTIPEKYDFTWVHDSDERPLFRTQGGDMGMMLTLGESPIIGPYPNLNYQTEVFKFGDQYYLAVGDKQKLLFNTGTIAPVF